MLSKKENSDPPSKKRKLSLSRKGKGRFSSVSEDHLTVMSKPQVPKNTEKASKWAMGNFYPNNTCLNEVLTPICSKEVLTKWLCVFINGTRSKTGGPYPPKMIRSSLAGILCSMSY